MRNLISLDYKHLLWKDEIGDEFLLFKWGEIYQYGENILRVITWSPSIMARMYKQAEKSSYFKTDDTLHVFDIKIQNLPILLSRLRIPKKRFARRSKFIELAKEKLGHDIIPSKPRKTEFKRNFNHD